jgi:transketolase
MTDVVELAREAEQIREALAGKEHRPEERLAEIEQKLEAHWAEQHARRVEAEQEFERILDAYEPAAREADEAVSALVEKVTRAVELRRQLEVARRKAGAGAVPTTAVRASRDRELRELRQTARLAAGQVY